MKRETILIVAIVIALTALVAVAFWRSSPSSPAADAVRPSAARTPTPTPPIPAQSSFMPALEYPQLSLKTMSKAEALQIYVNRLRHDGQADWKIPMNFYGKVVDENNQPVSDAKVHFGWTTVGVPGNYAEAETSSNGEGLFSLTGQHGKELEVRVEKDGYYPVEHGNGILSFEFAQPAAANYYEPDSDNPVIFHLRKKGEGAKLFSKSLNVSLNNNHPQDRVNLMQGFIKSDGNLIIVADTSKFLPGAQPFPWTVTLNMTEGGLVETDSQFPFLAPTSGYISTVTMDMTNLDRSVWRGQMTKTYYFYLPSTNTYGRMTINASSSLPLGLSYVYNLSPGGRVLEQAPSK